MGGVLLLLDEDLLNLIREYDMGRISFAEIFLISGKTVKDCATFLKKYNVKLGINVGFLDKGRGLNEEELKLILEGVS